MFIVERQPSKQNSVGVACYYLSSYEVLVFLKNLDDWQSTNPVGGEMFIDERQPSKQNSVGVACYYLSSRQFNFFIFNPITG